jgi:hypothetical protein
MQTQWNAGPGELASDYAAMAEDLDAFDELERVNAQLAQTVQDQALRVVSILGEARQQRTTLRQLAEASLKGLAVDDRALVLSKFGYVAPVDTEIPF